MPVQLRMRSSALGMAVIAFAAAALMALSGGVSTAHAAEHQFCWGVNLGPGAGCESGTWNMTGAFGSSTGGIVCIYLSQGAAACDKTESEGIYVPGSGASQRAIIFHYNGTIKAYGLFFT